MKKFLNLLQVFIKFMLLFFIAFVWFKFMLKSLWQSVVFSFIFSICVLLLIYFLQKSRNAKFILKQNEKDDAESMFLSLIKDENCLDFFYNLFSSRYKNIEKTKSFLVLKDINTIVFPYIKFDDLREDDIVSIRSICKKANPKKIVIISSFYSKNVADFVKIFKEKIILLNKYETYNLLYKDFDFYPSKVITKNKKSFKDALSQVFSRKQTKGFIISSIILFISSFFVKITIYYCIFVSILLIFAFISMLPSFNKISQEKSL